MEGIIIQLIINALSSKFSQKKGMITETSPCIVVLGAGIVGSVIAREMAKTHEVIAIDHSEERLNQLRKNNPSIQCLQKNLLDSSINFKELLFPASLVISAVPGFMGHEILKQIIIAGKNCVDISFFPESIKELNELAIQNGVSIVMDCGVAPGMSNLILGYYEPKMKIEEFVFYVGGLPIKREKPFEYKAPFSPIDVIEEYTRSARIRKKGSNQVVPAMSGLENLQFEGVGQLEGFYTDGLRSLLDSFPNIPEMTEKTLRYPGHTELIETLRSIGFFKKEHIEATAKVLIECWKQTEDDHDLTVMKVLLRGIYNQKETIITYSLLDFFDKNESISSMARTTGFTCCAMAECLLDNRFTKKGVSPPEIPGKEEYIFNFIISYLKNRGVEWTCTIS